MLMSVFRLISPLEGTANKVAKMVEDHYGDVILDTRNVRVRDKNPIALSLGIQTPKFQHQSP
jgi:hypothetical protein